MEQAPLDPGARPFGRDRLGEPAPAVGDHHAGRGHRDRSDLHAALVSARARCHESTCASVQAIRTTASRATHMPSTKTTRCASSTTSGIGRIDQKEAV